MEFTDDVLQWLRTEDKAVTNPRAQWQEQKGSKQKTYQLQSMDSQRKYRLYLRQNLRLPDHYSCGISIEQTNGEVMTLARYNGSNHPHFNAIEGERIDFQCHIHLATERYIAAGMKADTYAKVTTCYNNLDGALRLIVADCHILGLDLPPELVVGDLFDEH